MASSTHSIPAGWGNVGAPTTVIQPAATTRFTPPPPPPTTATAVLPSNINNNIPPPQQQQQVPQQHQHQNQEPPLFDYDEEQQLLLLSAAEADNAGAPTNASISNRPHFQSEIYISEPQQLRYLSAADFQRPLTYPSPLHVKPPTIAPHLIRPKSRWSECKYCNPQVPSYIPPELVLWGEGKPLQMLLARASIEDMIRLQNFHVQGLFFMRKDGELPEDFKGRPDHTMYALLDERKNQFDLERQMTKEFLAARGVNSVTANRARRTGGAGGGGAFGNLEYTSDGKIVHRLFFTPQVMSTQRYAAIFGSRGATHRQIEKDTGCRIILGGRGITELKRVRRPQDFEDAKKLLQYEGHAMITAPSEKELKLAVQKIEWLLSDDPEAVAQRDELKRKAEKDAGYTSSKTATTTTRVAAATAAAVDAATASNAKKANKKDENDGAQEDEEDYYYGATGNDDEDVEHFLKTL